MLPSNSVSVYCILANNCKPFSASATSTFLIVQSGIHILTLSFIGDIGILIYTYKIPSLDNTIKQGINVNGSDEYNDEILLSNMIKTLESQGYKIVNDLKEETEEVEDEPEEKPKAKKVRKTKKSE